VVSKYDIQDPKDVWGIEGKIPWCFLDQRSQDLEGNLYISDLCISKGYMLLRDALVESAIKYLTRFLLARHR
jgi:hypothetical protein